MHIPWVSPQIYWVRGSDEDVGLKGGGKWVEAKGTNWKAKAIVQERDNEELNLISGAGERRRGMR